MPLPTLLTFLGYLGLLLVIGAVAFRQTHDLGDYLLGGRRLGPLATALSAGASDMSGWLLLGLPGAVYVSGLSEAWIVIGLLAGAFCNWQWVARPLRERTFALDAVTLPDYLEARFNDDSRLLRLASAIVILLFFAFYAAAGLVAGAKLFSTTFGMDYLTGLFVGGLVIVAYTAVGGFLAVTWTDVVQGLLMLLALVVVPLVMLAGLGGAAATMSALGGVSDRHLDLVPASLSALGILSLLAWGLGYFGQPHVLVRFMAIASPERMATAKWIGMSWMLVTTMASVAVGLLGAAWFGVAGESLPAGDAEKVFIRATQLLFNPWIAGILLAAILAAVMSTIDSQLLVASSALSEDFYKAWLKPDADAKELVIVGRMTVVAIAGVAMVIALDPARQVLGLVSYAWAGLGASFGPVILLSLYGNPTRTGALAGMITGAATVVVWKPLSGGPFGILGVYELLPAFLFALIVIVTVSRLTQSSADTLT